MYISETSYQKDFNQITKSLMRAVMSDLVSTNNGLVIYDADKTVHNWKEMHRDHEGVQYQKVTRFLKDPGEIIEDDNIPYVDLEVISITEPCLFTYQLTSYNDSGVFADDAIELQFTDKEEMIRVMGQDFTDNFYILLQGEDNE